MLADDADSDLNEWADSLLGEFLVPSTYPYTLLNSFLSHTRLTPPPSLRASSRHATFHARQIMKEQKALLETFFLLFYTRFIPDSKVTVAFLGVLKETGWGKRQAAFGWFDEEARGIASEVECLLGVIGAELLDLEKTINEVDARLVPPPENPMPNTNEVFYPSNLENITRLVLDLESVDPKRAALLWLGWAYLLCKITVNFRAYGVHSEYREFALQILPLSDFPASELEDLYRTRTSLPNPLEPAFQLLASRALVSGSFFSSILEILNSTLLSPISHISFFHSLSSRDLTLTAGPNALGYLSVLKSIIGTIPMLIKLPTLPTHQWTALIDVFSHLYSSAASAPLRSHFWAFWSERMNRIYVLNSYEEEGEDRQDRSVRGEIEILDLSAARFPLLFNGFLKAVKSLCNPFRSTSKNLILLNVEHGVAPSDGRLVFDMIRRGLNTLTLPVPAISPLVPLPYEVLEDSTDGMDGGIRVRCVRDIFVSPSLRVPVGTEGMLVNRQPVVVAWEMRWNGWKLCRDLVDVYGRKNAGRSVGGAPGWKGTENPFQEKTDKLPMGWEEEECIFNLFDFLDVLNAVLKNEPDLGRTLLNDIASFKSPSRGGLKDGAWDERKRLKTPDFLETLFHVFERTLVEQSQLPNSAVTTTHELLLGFLHSASNQVWAFLRQNHVLIFPVSLPFSKQNGARSSHSANTIQAERLSGRYPVTLSLLSLVHGLVLDAQRTCYITDSAYVDVKRDVLSSALKWVRDEVWASFLNWKYADLSQKHEIGFRVLTIFSVLVQEAALLVGKNVEAERYFLRDAAEYVVDAFLANATLATLDPLLWIAGSGSTNILALRKKGGTSSQVEIERVEATIRSALELMRQLLMVKKLLGGPPSLLEKVMFGSLNSASNTSLREPIKALINYIISPHSTTISRLAARVLTFLTNLSAAWDAPSLLSQLGSLEDTEKLLPSIFDLLEDEYTDSYYRTSLWDMISSIVDHQSALGILFVTGSHIPSIDPPGDSEKSRTAVTIAFGFLSRWEELYGVTKRKPSMKKAGQTEEDDAELSSVPHLLAAILRFLNTAWMHFSEFGQALLKYREDSKFWSILMSLASVNVGTVADTADLTQEGADWVGIDENISGVCHKLMAKIYAVQIVTVDVQMSMRPSTTKGKEKAKVQKSLDSFLNSIADVRSPFLKTAISSAVSSHCEPELHARIRHVLNTVVPAFKIEDCRRSVSHLPDGEREYGEDYIYDISMTDKKLSGFVDAGKLAEMDVQRLVEVIKLTNHNWSLTDCEIAFSRSWKRLLDCSTTQISKDPKTVQPIFDMLESIIEQVSEEEKGGEVMLQVQSERLNLLLTLMEIASFAQLKGSNMQVKASLIGMAKGVVQIVTNRALPVRESVMRQSSVRFHRTVFRLQYATFKLLVSNNEWKSEDMARLLSALETAVRAHISFMSELLLLATQLVDNDLRLDIAYGVALFQQLSLLSTGDNPLGPRSNLWFAQFYDSGFVSKGLIILNQMLLFQGRPFYVPHIFDVFIACASLENGAELLALEGFMAALCNNALTNDAERGAIPVVDPRFDGERSPLHRIWCQMVILAGSMVKTLGDSPQFMEHDLVAFLQLYKQQIEYLLSYKVPEPLSLGALEGMLVSSSLIYHCLSFSHSDQTRLIAKMVSHPLLHLLQQINYLLVHPNQLAGLLEGMDDEEAWLFERESKDTVAEKWIEGKGRDVLKSVVGSLVTVVDHILLSLVIISQAGLVISRDDVDWPVDGIAILPTNKISLEEPASIGTLFDLLDVIVPSCRLNSSTSSAAGLKSTFFPPPLCPFNPSTHRRAILRVIESTLILLAAQMALVLQSPMTGLERVKREVKGQMAGDLMSWVKRVEGEEGIDKKLMWLLKKWSEGRLMS
ncbi:hypothetical protein BT69DRAFT_406129 [Atractiella rhizophila]|nr:hypothetical protein BT69DRAFT_406129 [Atractiella rhizophila]